MTSSTDVTNRRWIVGLRGLDVPMQVDAQTRSRARYLAYLRWADAYACTFAEFLAQVIYIRVVTPKVVADPVARWNERHPVGTSVRFYPTLGLPRSHDTRTRSAAWLLSGHTPVVMVDGQPGCVALEHLEVRS